MVFEISKRNITCHHFSR